MRASRALAITAATYLLLMGAFRAGPTALFPEQWRFFSFQVDRNHFLLVRPEGGTAGVLRERGKALAPGGLGRRDVLSIELAERIAVGVPAGAWVSCHGSFDECARQPHDVVPVAAPTPSRCGDLVLVELPAGADELDATSRLAHVHVECPS